VQDRDLASNGSVAAGEERVESTAPAQLLHFIGALGRRRQGYTQAADVTADFEAVAADQLRQRAVDRVRALPPDRYTAPAADAFRFVERERGKCVVAARPKGIHVPRVEPERLEPVGTRQLIPRRLPRAAAVAY